MIINFMNDYNSPCHPAVLNALANAARNKYPGYGTDDETAAARDAIRALTGAGGTTGVSARDSAGRWRGCCDVHFITGGTQTNLTAISAFLRPHEAVIAAGSSHIQAHETGAIEAVGHRILLTNERPTEKQATDGQQANRGDGSGAGKLTAGAVRDICAAHDGEHMVKPHMVYISQSTELGGVYRLAELRAIREVCDEYGLYLYMDGARLAAALTSTGNDAELSDIAALCDAFYLGGTKNGLLFGEALVIMNPALTADFRYYQKQRGGLLAKGFLLGIQYRAILENGLYFETARHANAMAAKLGAGLRRLGCRFYVESPTNQIFPIVSDETADRLAEGFLFEVWERLGGGETAIRLVTSWNTAPAEVDAFLAAYNDLAKLGHVI